MKKSLYFILISFTLHTKKLLNVNTKKDLQMLGASTNINLAREREKKTGLPYKTSNLDLLEVEIQIFECNNIDVVKHD